MNSYVKPTIYTFLLSALAVICYFCAHPIFALLIMAIPMIVLGGGCLKAEHKYDKAAEFINDLTDCIDELQEEVKTLTEAEPTEVHGARLAVTDSGAVEFANAWLSAMPSDTIRDFVVKFDGWKKEDWTMWVRLPWGKYQEHKAEIDFAVGRNAMKEAERKDELNGN